MGSNRLRRRSCSTPRRCSDCEQTRKRPGRQSTGVGATLQVPNDGTAREPSGKSAGFKGFAPLTAVRGDMGVMTVWAPTGTPGGGSPTPPTRTPKRVGSSDHASARILFFRRAERWLTKHGQRHESTSRHSGLATMLEQLHCRPGGAASNHTVSRLVRPRVDTRQSSIAAFRSRSAGPRPRPFAHVARTTRRGQSY